MEITDKSKGLQGVPEFKIYARFDKWHQRQILNFLELFNNNTFNQNWNFKYLERYGILKDSWEVNNLIMSAGKAQLALLGGDATAIPFTYIALGTSNTAVAVGQTALQSESVVSGLARAAATVSRTTTNVTNDTLTLSKTFTSGGSATIEEIGVFNASSSGTMLGRALTTSKILTNGDIIACTYNIIFS